MLKWRRLVTTCKACVEGRQRLLLSTQASDPLKISLDQDTGVSVITMQKKPANTLELGIFSDLHKAIKDLEANDKCRGVIITSAIPNIFSAGVDLRVFSDWFPDQFRPFWNCVQQTWISIYSSRLVTMAAINGHAPAGGTVISLACDYRLLARGPYSLGVSEAQVGVAIPPSMHHILAETIGKRDSERAIILGELFSPEDALDIGLVDELCEGDELMDKAKQEMSEWLEISDEVRMSIKKHFRAAFQQEFLETAEKETDSMVDVLNQPSTQSVLTSAMSSLKEKKNKQ